MKRYPMSSFVHNNIRFFNQDRVQNPRVGKGARGRSPAPRAPRPRPKWRPEPRVPERPRPNGRAESPSSRAATHPAQLSRIAGCAANPARACRRHARRKFRDGRAAVASSAMAGPRPGSVTTVLADCLVALAERVMLNVSTGISIRDLT
jgi:hypothetical protein